MRDLSELCAAIAPVSADAVIEVQRELDRKTKPARSLGRLEDLAVQLTAIRGRRDPLPLDKRIVVMGADHGVAAEGVSAYPQAVTAQMMLNFAAGGAAINQLCKAYDLGLKVFELALEYPTPDISREDAFDEAGHARELVIRPPQDFPVLLG